MIILNYLENASFCSKVNASTALSLGGMCIESPPASFRLVKSLTKHMRPYQQIDLASKVPGSDIWILYPPLGNSFALSWRSPIRIRTSGTADGEIAGTDLGLGGWRTVYRCSTSLLTAVWHKMIWSTSSWINLSTLWGHIFIYLQQVG